MELRLMRKHDAKRVALPFANEGVREFGSGKLFFNENGFPFVMEDNDIIMPVNSSLTIPNKKVDMPLFYLKIIRAGEYLVEYCWDPLLWDAYIVNDNGKTIEKL
jgi:hypothetical protein